MVIRIPTKNYAIYIIYALLSCHLGGECWTGPFPVPPSPALVGYFDFDCPILFESLACGG